MTSSLLLHNFSFFLLFFCVYCYLTHFLSVIAQSTSEEDWSRTSNAYDCVARFTATDQPPPPQWRAANAEIKVPSGENTELKRSPFIAWSGSVYSNTCYAYYQGYLPCLFLPFQPIHLHFFQNLSQFFPMLALANTGSCVGPQNKIGQPAWCGFLCWVPAEYK